MWFANIAMPILSFWVYYRAGIYADFMLNIYYFIIAVYGYLCWKGFIKSRNVKKNSTLQISHIPAKRLLFCFIIFGLIYSGIAYWLINFTDSTVSYWDALNTSLSIVAMWMLAKKYIEQWIAWIIVDIISVGLYFYKDRVFYGVLYTIYVVVAVFGYFKWKKLMLAQSNNQIELPK